mmetsp:Transcript_80087/g.259438  ORF Transcript_80087/g.259438 Transcript_80087/m.259438 type:complete len:209 (-) Transcript_80087:41-667(-)
MLVLSGQPCMLGFQEGQLSVLHRAAHLQVLCPAVAVLLDEGPLRRCRPEARPRSPVEVQLVGEGRGVAGIWGDEEAVRPRLRDGVVRRSDCVASALAPLQVLRCVLPPLCTEVLAHAHADLVHGQHHHAPVILKDRVRVRALAVVHARFRQLLGCVGAPRAHGNDVLFFRALAVNADVLATGLRQGQSDEGQSHGQVEGCTRHRARRI